jgi:hypothetical protein
MAAKKKQDRPLAGNVERTTVKGRTVWRVHSAKSGRVLSVTTKSSSARSMKKTNARYGEALRSLADR